jgi:hypothetical protein
VCSGTPLSRTEGGDPSEFPMRRPAACGFVQQAYSRRSPRGSLREPRSAAAKTLLCWAARWQSWRAGYCVRRRRHSAQSCSGASVSTRGPCVPLTGR